jgi:hypothetical protein
VTALIDTNFLYALFDADDNHHAAAYAHFQSAREDKIIVSSVLPEAIYLIGTRLGYPTAIRFVRAITLPLWQHEMVSRPDLLRAAKIMETYVDAQIDFVDCSLIAVAERLRITRIWTFDRRDFTMVRPGHTPFFELLPD